MRKINQLLLTVFIILGIFTLSFAQTETPKTERRIIEVTGSAEMLIMPNEFTFKITLVERIENKQKITIEQQEAKLRTELTNIGVDVEKNLAIFDISSSYIYSKKLKDTLGSKEYRLKLTDINKIARLQEIADRLNISRLDLIDSNHSELTRFRQETKIEAIKAAKYKADYLLGAIGEKVGKPVYILEVEENSVNGMRARSNIVSNGVLNMGDSSSSSSLSFEKIKIRFEILAKFEIQ